MPALGGDVVELLRGRVVLVDKRVDLPYQPKVTWPRSIIERSNWRSATARSASGSGKTASRAGPARKMFCRNTVNPSRPTSRVPSVISTRGSTLFTSATDIRQTAKSKWPSDARSRSGSPAMSSESCGSVSAISAATSGTPFGVWPWSSWRGQLS
jgi:hypothetical protein